MYKQGKKGPCSETNAWNRKCSVNPAVKNFSSIKKCLFSHRSHSQEAALSLNTIPLSFYSSCWNTCRPFFRAFFFSCFFFCIPVPDRPVFFWAHWEYLQPPIASIFLQSVRQTSSAPFVTDFPVSSRDLLLQFISFSFEVEFFTFCLKWKNRKRNCELNLLILHHKVDLNFG